MVSKCWRQRFLSRMANLNLAGCFFILGPLPTNIMFFLVWLPLLLDDFHAAAFLAPFGPRFAFSMTFRT